MSAPRNRRQVDKLVDVVEDMRGVLGDLTRDVLADLVRRAEQVAEPDGYPTSSRSSSATLARSGDPDILHTRSMPGATYSASAGGDPTGDIVVQRATYQHRDVVGDTLAEIVASLYEARGLLRKVDKRRKAVVHAGALVKEISTSVQSTCECCGRSVSGDGEDRLKQGYGSCCYKPWTRWRKDEIASGRDPSRVRFERWHESQHTSSAEPVPTPSTSGVPNAGIVRVR